MVKCVVIDDEQPARELIRLHISLLEDFQLLASFDNAMDGFNFLQRNSVDLIFLDIQMPKLSGLQLARSIQNAPGIIFTTAHREYAAEAFDLDVLDYLVKPITRERFMKAISKYHHYNQSIQSTPDISGDFSNAYVFLKVGKGQIKIFLNDIIYIEGFKDFTKVHTANKVYVASERLSYMEEKLPEHKFARVHKSFLVSLEKISSVFSDQILVGTVTLPIGRVFKNEFLKKLSLNEKK